MRSQGKTRKLGSTPTCSNRAIVTMVSLKSVVGLSGRVLRGFVKLVFKLMGLKLLPVQPTSGKRHVMFDIERVR
ncbi:MAG: transposase [Cyanobacteria bacterium J06627_28]